jgi:phosphatidylglycerol:prolipoprotein diacylglycerol transferase
LNFGILHFDAVYVGLMLAAIGLGFLLTRRFQEPLALSRSERLGILIGAFCGAMLGAKLPFVISDWEGLRSGAAWFSDGKTIMFGLVGGYAGVELAKAILQVRVKTGDTFAVPVPLAVAVGRLGCFRAGCCYGTPTGLPWGVDFGDHIARHPTQLYEAAFHLTAAVVLFLLLRKGLFRGQLFKLYLLAYFAFRFLSESLRPEPRLWLELTGYQWAALALIPTFALLWWNDARFIGRGARCPAAPIPGSSLSPAPHQTEAASSNRPS